MPKRINPIAQYLIYLAGTLAAYGIYATTVVPKIESNDNVAEAEFEPRTVAKKTNRKEKFAHLFPRDAWELGPCKVLETTQGTVLFKDYLPYDDGHVDVKPFTMIIRGEPKSDGRPSSPIVLRSSDKAVLKFERAFQLDGGDPGKIQNGELAGQVSIYRPPSTPGAKDFLKVLTSNVQLQKHKIFTVDDVEFEFGNSHGRGRNLAIELSHNTPLDAINNDFSKINGVKKLKLGYLQKIRFQAPVKKSNAGRMLAGQNAPLEIRCQGAFGFDFEQQTAEFFDRVTVNQLDGSGQSLTCEQLTLIFDTEPNNRSTIVEADPTNPADQDFRLRKVVAIGNPLRLVAKSKDATVQAEYLEYDINLNTIAAKSDKQVLFQMGNQQFTGRNIRYQIQDDGALGPLTANGPGKMRRVDEEKSFSAAWNESFSIQAGEQDEKLVNLKGQSELILDQQTQVSGDEIQIRLWEIPQPTSNNELLPSESKAPDRSSFQYLPRELQAIGKVAIVSPKANGTMQNLLAQWPHPTANAISSNRFQRVNKVALVQGQDFDTETNLAPIQPRSQGAAPATYTSYPTQNSNRRRPATEVRPVQYEQPIQQATERETSAQISFSAKTAEVDFSGHDREAKISQLILEGQVVVREINPTNPGSQPLEVIGEQVFLIPQGENLYRLNVAGSGKVVAKGLTLSGPDIHLDQNANRLWVVGAGAMNVRQAAEQGEKTAANDITINWQGGMIFDGHKMYFEDEVSASGMQSNDAQRSQVRSLSAGLSVMLSKEINFRQPKGEHDQGIGDLEIREMILVDHLSDEKRVFEKPASQGQEASKRPVVFEKLDLDLQGQVVGKQKMIVPHASVDMTNGNVRASGPGTLMNWQIGQPNGTNGVFQQASAQMEPNRQAASKSFLRINFDKLLVADGQSSHVHIDGKVRTIYAPVDNFEQQFNPDNTTRPVGAIKLTCEQMELAQWQQRGSSGKTNELSAKGNARIVGDQFNATAERLNYSEAKDLLTLEGSTRSTANLSFSDPNARSQRKLAAGKILYRPSDGWTEIQKVQEATMSQQGSMFNNR